MGSYVGLKGLQFVVTAQTRKLMLRNEGTIVGLDFDINVLDILEFILYVLYPLAKSLYIDLIIDGALQFKQSVFNLLQV